MDVSEKEMTGPNKYTSKQQESPPRLSRVFRPLFLDHPAICPPHRCSFNAIDDFFKTSVSIIVSASDQIVPFPGLIGFQALQDGG